MSVKESIDISVVLAQPGQSQRVELAVPRGTTARAAALLSAEAGIDYVGTGADPAHSPLGVYSIRISDDYPLQSGDRLEVYRPLQQDPMELRRRRARQKF